MFKKQLTFFTYLCSMKTIIFLISFFSVVACTPTKEDSSPEARTIDSLRQKVGQYEAAIQEAGNQMSGMTTFLDSVSQTRPELAKMPKREAKAMLKSLDSVLNIKAQQVANLSQKLKQKGDNYAVLATALENQKREIERLKSENEDLVRQLDEVKGEVTKLKTENTTLNTDLGSTKQQLSDKETELAKLTSEIAKAQATLQSEGSKIKNASTAFYDLGLMLVKAADKTWGATKSDQKRQFTQEAYCAFAKARKLGHLDAEYQLNKMNTNEEFKKYLVGVKCE